MVCQCLALIMGFVSVCLRKWHARVPAPVCVCKTESTWAWKKMYIQYAQVIISSGG